MKKIDEFKLWIKCKKEGRIEEYNYYKECKETVISDINRYSNYLKDAIEKFEIVKQKYPKNSNKYFEAKNEVSRWRYTLEERKLGLYFIRPNNKEDIAYRDKQCKEFTEKLQKLISPNFDLRFHGTPIYYAQQIIKSGHISSSADRYEGYIKSTDMKGEISASSAETVGRTINFFSDMTSYQRSMPAGCIFAILPKDKEDANYGKDLMHFVDFKRNPSQLFGIFTTPENVESVKQWMKQSELNPDIVYTFEEFLQTVEIKSAIIDNQIKNIIKYNVEDGNIRQDSTKIEINETEQENSYYGGEEK